MASALTYLHGEGIVFRDVSAANVVLTSTVPAKADIKLIDFGLHKRLAAQSAALPAEGAPSAPHACTAFCWPIDNHLQYWVLSICTHTEMAHGLMHGCVQASPRPPASAGAAARVKYSSCVRTAAALRRAP